MAKARRSVCGAILLVVCWAAGGWSQEAPAQTPAPPSNADFQSSVRQFTRVYRLVEQHYASPMDPNVAIYGPSDVNTLGTLGAIPAMLRVLDPHSNFFDPTRYAALRQEMEGKYFGVGMEIAPRPGKMGKMVTEVLKPLPGSPAFKAGLRPGDIIDTVDGKSVLNIGSNQVADLLRGPQGTVVRVTVLREGLKRPLEFTLTRQKITQLSVDSAFMVRPGIAYIHISTFNETTDPQLSRDLDRLGENNFKGLIVDLRNNRGGLLEQAVEVASHFLRTSQLVVYHYGRSSSMHRYSVVHGEQGPEYPMVVLINGNTASAAEIVTGALQDHDRALVMGQRSFGKGLVQTEFPLSDDTMLLLTTAHYYTPSGRLIQRDYSHISLYDYYNHFDPAPLPHTQARLTDGGRVVYGGGGITPDVPIPAEKLDATQQRLMDAGAFLDFGREYLGSHKTIARGFKPDRKVLEDFQKFLVSDGITISAQDFQANESFIREHIRIQMIAAIYGVEAGSEIGVKSDPLVSDALNHLGQARDLLIEAHRYMASRGER